MKKMVCVVIIALFAGSLAVSAAGFEAGLYGGFGQNEGATAIGAEVQIGADAYSNGWGVSVVGGLGYNFDYLIDAKLSLLAEFFWGKKIGINFLGTGIYGGLNFFNPMLGATIPFRLGDFKLGLDVSYLFPSLVDSLSREGGLKVGLFVHLGGSISNEELAYIANPGYSGSSPSTGTATSSFQTGTYKLSGTNPNNITMKFIGGVLPLVYYQIDGSDIAQGSYKVNGDVLTIEFTMFYGDATARDVLQDKILVYTIAGNTFSGNGVSYARSGL